MGKVSAKLPERRDRAGSAGPVPAGLRTVRAAFFTAVCVVLSSGAHVLLSGAPLPLLPVIAVTVAVFLTAFVLAGSERSFTRIAALMVPLELAADTVLTTGQHACYGRAGGPVTGPLRTFGIDLLCSGGTLGTPLARLTAHGRGTAGPSPLETDPAVPWLLLAAHVALGLAAAAWLRRGEAALARLLRAAAATAFRPLRTALTARCPAPAAPLRSGRSTAPSAPPRMRPLLIHSVHRRGPPLPVLAA